MKTENNPLADSECFEIRNVDRMEPFFMNVVSGTDLWTFMSSNGGITAGRRSADWALFQYETDDRVTASAENTGSKTLVRISGDARCWEPFSPSLPSSPTSYPAAASG